MQVLQRPTILDKQTYYLLKIKQNKQLHQNSLNIFQQIVWHIKHTQPYVLKFVKVLEEKYFKVTWLPVKA